MPDAMSKSFLLLFFKKEESSFLFADVEQKTRRAFQKNEAKTLCRARPLPL
jgi:hypothetical protein